PLNTQIVQTGSIIHADVSGDTPPFQYQWSEGSTVPQIAPSGFGGYAVTITDSHGCSVTKTFYYTGISNLDVAKVSIYPNPLTHSELLTLEFSVNEIFK